MARDTANGGLAQIMEQHYKTFIVGHIFFLALGYLAQTSCDTYRPSKILQQLLAQV